MVSTHKYDSTIWDSFFADVSEEVKCEALKIIAKRAEEKQLPLGEAEGRSVAYFKLEVKSNKTFQKKLFYCGSSSPIRCGL